MESYLKNKKGIKKKIARHTGQRGLQQLFQEFDLMVFIQELFHCNVKSNVLCCVFKSLWKILLVKAYL